MWPEGYVSILIVSRVAPSPIQARRDPTGPSTNISCGPFTIESGSCAPIFSFANTICPIFWTVYARDGAEEPPGRTTRSIRSGVAYW